MTPTLTEALRTRALALGFDGCRITTADPPASGPRLLEAITEGRHADMAWLARNADKRVDPQRVLPGARSILTVAASYAVPDGGTRPHPAAGPVGEVARYARHADYHDVLATPLRALAEWMDGQGGPGTRSLWYVDTGPVLERDLAQRAGLGFVGRHTGLVSRGLGNWFLIAEILTTLDLEPDPPEPNRCGRCTRCLEACPTGALPAPFTLDARRCLSYLTIEHRGPIPEEFRVAMGARIFGCDDCLAACPWNRFARAGALLRAHHRPDLDQPSLLELLALDDDGFRERFRRTPLWRTKRRGLRRNVCVALGNVGDAGAEDALRAAAGDPEPVVDEAARWALDRLRTRGVIGK